MVRRGSAKPLYRGSIPLLASFSTSPGVEIGRQTTLKMLWRKLRAGSSPAPGTMSQDLVFTELDDGDGFEPLSIDRSTPFTQSKAYGEWQKSAGRKVRRFIGKKADEVKLYFQIIKFPLTAGKSYLYAPYGPIVKDLTESDIKKLSKKIKDVMKEEGSAFARLDFTPPKSVSAFSAELSKHFKRSKKYTYHSAAFQPRTEWYLDLDKSEGELLKNMHTNARYSINLASRKGVEVKIINSGLSEHLDTFYAVSSETAKRDEFILHEKEYYRIVFENADEQKNGFLSIASYQGKIITVDFILIYGDVANYVFGSSSNEFRNLMPTYIAQWAAIKESKKLGCKSYNFGGIVNDKNKKTYKGWEGLSFFKRKFGGREVEHSDLYDAVNDGFVYSLYNLRKLLRRFI